MIVYASLEPFSGWMAPLPGTPFFLFAPWPARYTRFDIAINVVAYLPFGFFVALTGRHTQQRSAARDSDRAGGAVVGRDGDRRRCSCRRATRARSIWFRIPPGARSEHWRRLVLNGTPGLRARDCAMAPSRLSRRKERRPGPRPARHLAAGAGEPRHLLFAATFDPSLELTRDLAGTLLQAAQSAFNVVGVGLFLALLLNRRRYLGGAATGADRRRLDPEGRRRDCSAAVDRLGQLAQAGRDGGRRRWRDRAAADVSIVAAVADDALRHRAALVVDRAAARARHVAGAGAAGIVRLALRAPAQFQRLDARRARGLARASELLSDVARGTAGVGRAHDAGAGYRR